MSAASASRSTVVVPAAIWTVAAAAALAVVKGTAIGPVVLVVSHRHGWGVHVGDGLAVVPVLAAAVAHLGYVRGRYQGRHCTPESATSS